MSEPTGPTPPANDLRPDDPVTECRPAGGAGPPSGRTDPTAGPGAGAPPSDQVRRLAELLLEAAGPEPGARTAPTGDAASGPGDQIAPTASFALDDAGPVLASVA